MNRTKSKQWLLAFLSCLLLLTCMPVGWLPGVQAEGAVQLGVIAGIGGDYKETSFVPVQVTASNSGADIEGNLVVTVGDWGSNHLNVAYYQPISIAKGATKQVTISVPGNQVGPNTYVSLMQGDKVVAKASVGGRRYNGDTLFVGVLASHPDTANFLGAMPKTAFNNPVRVLPLKAEQMPVNRTQLQMVDVLLLNNFALDSLSGQQIDAIRQWTMAGGLLMIAGGAHYGKTAGELKDLSPVEATGVTTVAALPALTVDKNNTPGLDRPFTVSTGVLREGTAIYSEAGIPLVAVRTVGEGKVMYVAYDLAEEPVASWSGNSRFWADVLNKGFGTTIHRIHRSPMDGIWPLDHAADRIPALKMPDIKWLALFFAVYALIAGPVMFYLLRRKRKQSWMWGAVPALAVVTGIAIFTVGASQRGTKPLLHQVGFIQMLGNGSAQAKAVAAMFVPRSSDYEIEVEGSGRSWPILPYRPDQMQPKAWVWSQADRTQIQFKQVEFWSMRKVGTEQFLSDVGTFESDLRYVEGGLRGTVTNKSKYTLRDVTVATDTQNQRFPEIAPGETVTVELKFDPATQNRPYRGSRVHQFIPAQYQGNAGPYNNSREGQIVDILEESHNLAGARKAPVTLVGWMDAPAVEIGIKDKSYKPYNISLVAAPLSIKPSPEGYTFVPSGEIEAVRIGSSPGVDDVGDGYMMQGGEITFDFPIQPKQKNLAISKIHLYTWSNDNTPFDKQVYNWKTGEYDSYDKAFASNIMAQEKTSVYLSAEGTLRIKFSHSFNEHRHLGLPVISVEGKVIQP